MRLQAVLVTLAAFVSQTAYVLAAPSDSPSQAAQVDKLFRSWNTLTSPGCAIAVMKDSRILFELGYGMADLDHNVPITTATVFNVGFHNFPITTAAPLTQGKTSGSNPAPSIQQVSRRNDSQAANRERLKQRRVELTP